MWIIDVTLPEIVLRVAIVYIVILIGIRLSGKREIAQMTPIDLVLLLLIANAVQNAMTGPDTSVIGGLVAAGTLLLLNVVFSRLLWKHKTLRHFVEGIPTVLIHNGKILHANLDKEKISSEELQQALREHGVADVADVSVAMLEIDGSISVLKKDEMPQHSKPHHRIRLLQRKAL